MTEKEREVTPEHGPEPEGSPDQKPITRKAFVTGASAAGLGLAAAGIPGLARAQPWTKSSRNRALTSNRLAAGNIGGPTGFAGAARYQYPANSEEGRAILAAK